MVQLAMKAVSMWLKAQCRVGATSRARVRHTIKAVFLVGSQGETGRAANARSVNLATRAPSSMNISTQKNTRIHQMNRRHNQCNPSPAEASLYKCLVARKIAATAFVPSEVSLLIVGVLGIPSLEWGAAGLLVEAAQATSHLGGAAPVVRKPIVSRLLLKQSIWSQMIPFQTWAARARSLRVAWACNGPPAWTQAPACQASRMRSYAAKYAPVSFPLPP
mmetsp:Transcript_7638/g.23847  ORF Transcript_7638/g.23847 Transcript_7638/m.23847 type:complete len:219 (-) Transcript_7638:866-1522(-)